MVVGKAVGWEAVMEVAAMAVEETAEVRAVAARAVGKAAEG